MTDKQLLELAAKAAGYKTIQYQDLKSHGLDVRYGIDEAIWNGENYWNPLEDDGDALRLAVKLKLFVGPSDPILVSEFEYRGYKEGEYASGAGVDYVDSVGKIHTFNEISHDDPYAATRRAIVWAAAEIGKSMGEQA